MLSSDSNPAPTPTPTPNPHPNLKPHPHQVEILKSIHHPNIVKLLDVYNSETCVYLVMELVTGGHLQARLKEKGCYDEAQAKLLLAQVQP